MSIISAGTSNTTSLVYTGDTTGAMVFQTNGTTEAMRITSGQNVGIGTNVPTVKLDIAGSLKVTNSSGSSIVANRTSNPGSVEIQHSGVQTAQLSAVSGGGLEFYQGSSPTLAMKYDSAGRVTTPLQPSFYAWSGVGNVLFTTETPLPLNSTLWNTGSHYNTSNYRFTAPVAGKYFFRANIYKQGNGNYSRLRIQKNDVSYTYHLILASSAETLTITSIVDMAVNDYVTCTFQADGGGADVYMAADHTSFSGFLIG